MRSFGSLQFTGPLSLPASSLIRAARRSNQAHTLWLAHKLPQLDIILLVERLCAFIYSTVVFVVLIFPVYRLLVLGVGDRGLLDY